MYNIIPTKINLFLYTHYGDIFGLTSGNIIVAGSYAVGKTSIINRIRKIEISKIKPTLGVQIYKYIMHNIDFIIYDFPGQDKLRESWYNKSFEPNGIIFVVDCTSDKKGLIETKAEFDKLVPFFIDKESLGKIPLLIYGNKIDITPNHEGLLQDTFFDIGDYNFKLAYCSAKENTGITENFAWLVGEIVRLNLKI